jgi:hypothetical protein
MKRERKVSVRGLVRAEPMRLRRQLPQAELGTWVCRSSWGRGGVLGPSPWSPWCREACDPSWKDGPLASWRRPLTFR